MQPGRVFETPKTSDDLTGYSAAIGIRWGIKRPPNGMKFGRRSTYNIIRPQANFQPIPRTFYPTYKNNISEVPRARASVSGLRTVDGRDGEKDNYERMQVL